MKNIQYISASLLGLTLFTACASGQSSLSDSENQAIDAEFQKEYTEMIATWSPKNWPPLPANYKQIVEKMLVPPGKNPRDYPGVWQEEPIKELLKFSPSNEFKGKFLPRRSPKVGTKPYWMTCVESGSPRTTTYEFMGNGRAPGGAFVENTTHYGTVCVAWQNGKPYAAGARMDKGNATRTPLYGNNWTFVDPNNYLGERILYASPDGVWPAKPAAPADK